MTTEDRGSEVAAVHRRPAAPRPATSSTTTATTSTVDNSDDKRTSTISTGSRKSKSHIGPWRLGRTLGRGSSGRVRLAKHAVTGKLAAVKIVPKSIVGSLDDGTSRETGGLPYGIEREVIIMKLIEHPNVMALYDVWENKGELYLVLEYIEGGELFDYLIKKGRLEEREAVNYFRQIIHGVYYCHKFNICHRDLKPENLLLDKNRNIKIADFGMAALETERMLETSCGSPHYASPEIVAGQAYHGGPSDVWSCGIILFALLTGHLPFDDENIRTLLKKVKAGRYRMPSDLSPYAKDLISRMLQIKPESRISIEQILDHPLLRKYPSRTTAKLTSQAVSSTLDVKRPCKSESDVDEEILRNLQTLWHGENREKVIKRLLSPDLNPEKTFYCLLMKYRQDHRQDQPTVATTPKRSVQPMYVSSRHKSTASVSSLASRTGGRRVHSRNLSRASAITASSSHRRSVVFAHRRKASRASNATNTPKSARSPVTVRSPLGYVRGPDNYAIQSITDKATKETLDIPDIPPHLVAVSGNNAKTSPLSVPQLVNQPINQNFNAVPVVNDRPRHPENRRSQLDSPNIMSAERVTVRKTVKHDVSQGSGHKTGKANTVEISPRPASAEFECLCEEAFNNDNALRITASRAVSDPVESTSYSVNGPDRRAFSVGDESAVQLEVSSQPRYSAGSTTSNASTVRTQDGYILPMIFEEDRFADALEEEVDRVYNHLEYPRPIAKNNMITPVPSNDFQLQDQLRTSELLYTNVKGNTPIVPTVRAVHPATCEVKESSYRSPLIPKNMNIENGTPWKSNFSGATAQSSINSPRAINAPQHSQNRAKQVVDSPAPDVAEPKAKTSIFKRFSLRRPNSTTFTPSNSPAMSGQSPVLSNTNDSKITSAVPEKRQPMTNHKSSREHDSQQQYVQSRRTEDSNSQDKVSKPKQNWFMKMLSPRLDYERPIEQRIDASRTIYSLLSVVELRFAIMETLYRWEEYGVTKVSEDDYAVIRAHISSRNVLRARSTDFKIQVHTKQGIAVARFIKERGSKSTFLRFVAEMETALEILATQSRADTREVAAARNTPAYHRNLHFGHAGPEHRTSPPSRSRYRRDMMAFQNQEASTQRNGLKV